jgi:hypothetical protein
LLSNKVELRSWVANLDPTHEAEERLQQEQGGIGRLHVLESVVIKPGEIAVVVGRVGRHLGTALDWEGRNWTATTHPTYPSQYGLGSESGILAYGSDMPTKNEKGQRIVHMRSRGKNAFPCAMCGNMAKSRSSIAPPQEKSGCPMRCWNSAQSTRKTWSTKCRT